MTILVEKGIPIPDVVVKKNTPQEPRTTKYPWSQMEIGDSFFVPAVTIRQFHPQLITAHMRLGLYFLHAEAEKDGVKGVRVWRISQQKANPRRA